MLKSLMGSECIEPPTDTLKLTELALVGILLLMMDAALLLGARLELVLTPRCD